MATTPQMSQGHPDTPTKPQSSRSVRWLRRLVRLIVILIVCAVGLELSLRVVLLNHLPIVPYYAEGGVPTMPKDEIFTVAIGWKSPVRYVTDRWGARVASPAAQAPETIRDGDLFVVGDSQAMGYLMDFKETFAAQLAQRTRGSNERVRVLAAPGMNPSTSRIALQRYRTAVDLKETGLAVVVFNLGNDLDELFLAGDPSASDTSTTKRWLMMHSRLYAEGLSIYTLHLKPQGWPGANPILFTMDAMERVFLADQAVQLLEAHAQLLESADRVVFVVIPCSYQVDPALFEVFRANYASDEVFEQWNRQVEGLAAKMAAMDQFVARRLQSRGYEVLQVSELAANDGPGAKWYVQDTDHLTPYAHSRIAEALAHMLEEENGS